MRLGLAFALFTFSLSAAAKPLISSGDVTAELTGGCGETVPLNVTSPDPNYFSGDKVGLQKLLGGARVALSFQCPQATKIDVSGISAGVKIYSGSLAKATGWKLQGGAALAGATKSPKTAPAATPGQPASATGFGAPKPDFQTAYALLKAAHHDVLADDDRWLRTFIGLTYFQDGDAMACLKFRNVEQSNPITWGKQMDEARAKFRAELNKARGGRTTSTFTIRRNASPPPRYDAARGGMVMEQQFSPAQPLASLAAANASGQGSCMGGQGIAVVMSTELPARSNWLLPMSADQAESFINDINPASPKPPAPGTYPVRRTLQLEMLVQTEPPTLVAGKAQIPAKVIDMRLVRVDSQQGPKPAEKVAWTYPLGMPDNMPKIADTSDPATARQALNRGTLFLLAYSQEPAVLTDQQLLNVTQQQIYADQQGYTRIKQLQKQREQTNQPPLPESVFSWESAGSSRPELTNAIVQTLIDPGADLSAYEQAGFDKRKASILGVFMFSEEQVVGRDAEFLKSELKGAMRDFLKQAAAQADKMQTLEFPVQISYEVSTQTLKFPQGLMQSFAEQQPLYFGSLPAGNRDSTAIVYPQDVRNDWLYQAGGALPQASKRPPQIQGIQVHMSPVQLPYVYATFAFPQRLKLADQSMPKGKAEQFAKEGQLTARIVARFSNVLIGSRYSGGALKGTFPIIKGSVERIDFADRSGQVQLRLGGSRLPKESTKIEFAQPSDDRPDPVPFSRDLVDFLVLKYAPEKADEKFMFSMMLARYKTDAANEDANWLRFFAPLSKAGRQPTEQEFREMLPRFSEWAKGRAALVNELVVNTQFKLRPESTQVLNANGAMENCVDLQLSSSKEDKNRTRFTLGRCGGRGLHAGQVTRLKGMSDHRLDKWAHHQIVLPAPLPLTPAVTAGDREQVGAVLRLKPTGRISDKPYQTLSHFAELQQITYSDMGTGAEIASISGTQAKTMAQAAQDRSESQRATCKALTSIEEQVACFDQNCALLFDDQNACRRYVNNLRSQHRQRVQGCESRAENLQVPKATPGFDSVVAKCLAEAPRSAAGPDVLGLQIGMSFRRADELIRHELGIGMGGQTMSSPRDPRPFRWAYLYLTPNASQGVAVFLQSTWGPQDGNPDSMGMLDRVTAVSRNMQFDKPPPSNSVRDGLVKKYGKPVWQSGGAMLWASKASCRGATELLQPIAWRGKLWPVDRSVAMLTPDGPRPEAFEPYKDCGALVYANYDGSRLQTIAMDPGWFYQLPAEAFNREKGSELAF